MQISNDTPALNYVEYFTKQLPVDLANMAMLRDELAIRQGALSAAKDAIADRAKATEELTKAKNDADAMLAQAKEILAEAATSLADSKLQAKNLEEQKISTNAELGLREATVTKREKIADSKMVSLANQQSDIDNRVIALNEQEALLQSRVKAFQDKVAALSA
jgi:chromosome segregation ATPase